MMSKKDQIVKILNRGLYREYGIGEDESVEDKREQRSTFDSGVDLNTQGGQVPTESAQEPDEEEKSTKPPVKAKSNAKKDDKPNTKVIEEPDEEETKK